MLDATNQFFNFASILPSLLPPIAQQPEKKISSSPLSRSFLKSNRCICYFSVNSTLTLFWRPVTVTVVKLRTYLWKRSSPNSNHLVNSVTSHYEKNLKSVFRLKSSLLLETLTFILIWWNANKILEICKCVSGDTSSNKLCNLLRQDLFQLLSRATRNPHSCYWLNAVFPSSLGEKIYKLSTTMTPLEFDDGLRANVRDI